MRNLFNYLGIVFGLIFLVDFALPALLIILVFAIQLSFVQTKLNAINLNNNSAFLLLQKKYVVIGIVLISLIWIGTSITNQNASEWKKDRENILRNIDEKISKAELTDANKLIEKYLSVAKDDEQLENLSHKLSLALFAKDLPTLKSDLGAQYFFTLLKKLDAYPDNVKNSSSYKEFRVDFDFQFSDYKVHQERLRIQEENKKAAEAKATAMSAPSPKFDEDPRNVYLYCISNQIGICYKTPAECEEQRKYYGANERGAPHCKPEACGTAGTLLNTGDCKRKGH